MPFDLIPDFISIIGQLDDALIVAGVIRYVGRTAGRSVIEELWPGTERGLGLDCLRVLPTVGRPVGL